jgi:hypothetical protein
VGDAVADAAGAADDQHALAAEIGVVDQTLPPLGCRENFAKWTMRQAMPCPPSPA